MGTAQRLNSPQDIRKCYCVPSGDEKTHMYSRPCGCLGVRDDGQWYVVETRAHLERAYLGDPGTTIDSAMLLIMVSNIKWKI